MSVVLWRRAAALGRWLLTGAGVAVYGLEKNWSAPHLLYLEVWWTVYDFVKVFQCPYGIWYTGLNESFCDLYLIVRNAIFV